MVQQLSQESSGKAHDSQVTVMLSLMAKRTSRPMRVRGHWLTQRLGFLMGLGVGEMALP